MREVGMMRKGGMMREVGIMREGGMNSVRHFQDELELRRRQGRQEEGEEERKGEEEEKGGQGDLDSSFPSTRTMSDSDSAQHSPVIIISLSSLLSFQSESEK